MGGKSFRMGLFIGLLQAHGIKRLVDVRSFPRSRRNPQFNLDVLPGSLEEVGVEYRHMPGYKEQSLTIRQCPCEKRSSAISPH